MVLFSRKAPNRAIAAPETQKVRTLFPFKVKTETYPEIRHSKKSKL